MTGQEKNTARKAYDELEARVAARTVELVKANQQLQQEIAERARAESALRRYADEQTALYAVTLAATTFLDPDDLLSTVLDVVLSVLNADAGWAILSSPTLDAPYRIVAGRGVPASFLAGKDAVSLHTCAACSALLASEDALPEPVAMDECPCLSTEALADADLHSHVSIPLTLARSIEPNIRHRVLGILNIAWRAPRIYSTADHAFLTATGREVGLALHNAQLYQAALQVDRLQVLNDVGAAAVSSLDLDTVLRRVLEQTCRALDASRGSILLLDPDTGELVFTQSLRGEAHILQGYQLAPGEGIAGWVVQHGQSVRVNDVHSDPRFYKGVDTLTGLETHSLLCAPLIHGAKITGTIEIINKRQGEFGDEDLSLLEAMSSIAAAAIENARLYKAMRSYADRMVLLNQLGRTLTSTLNYATIVQTALTEIQRLFSAESVSLLQPDPQTGDLCFAQAPAGETPAKAPMHLRAGEGIARWALKHRQAMLVEDAQTDPRFSRHLDRQTNGQTRALMVVPLLTSERDVGVIQVASGEPGAYTREELNILQAIASTLTVALENARLYDELKVLLREREETQAQMIRAEKLAALGRLASSLAHELNNPLQAVTGSLDLALKNAAGREDVQRYIAIARHGAWRVASLVAQIRNLYRPISVTREPAEVNALLEQVLEISEKRCRESGIEVHWKPADNLPSLLLSPEQIRQVFLNLLLNAIEAMPDGGRLEIETARTEQPAGVRIDFCDTGVGITPDTLLRVFEPFYSTKPDSTGLGLSTSHAIVEQHGGYIEADSQVGEGSTFTVWLPA